jgi:uncharacterized protein GlcG (DUF336 family)
MEMFRATKYLTLDGAKKMMAAAEAEARKNNWNVAIAIVDAGGSLEDVVARVAEHDLDDDTH